MSVQCKHCNSTNLVFKDRKMNRYKCKDCGRTFIDDGEKTEPTKPKVGMTLSEFRGRFDVDFIVKRTLDTLEKNMIYEKTDIIKMTGLRAGFPGLSQTIDDQKKYYGKVASTMYFSHPDTIAALKEQAKLM